MRRYVLRTRRIRQMHMIETRFPLADEIQGYRPRGFFDGLNDIELLLYAHSLIERKGIVKKTELKMADSTLHGVLYKRKLMHKLRFRARRVNRRWAVVGDDALIAKAEKTIKEGDIRSRKGSREKDEGLYRILLARVLLERLGLGWGQRDWTKKSDMEIIAEAGKAVEEHGLENPRALQKADKGLYEALRRRGLLTEAFTRIEEKSMEGQVLDQLSDAVEVYLQGDWFL